MMSSPNSTTYTFQLSARELLLLGAFVGVGIGFGAFGILIHLQKRNEKEKERERERQMMTTTTTTTTAMNGGGIEYPSYLNRGTGTRRSQQYIFSTPNNNHNNHNNNHNNNNNNNNKHTTFALTDEIIEPEKDRDDDDDRHQEYEKKEDMIGTPNMHRAVTGDSFGLPLENPLGVRRLVRHFTSPSVNNPTFEALDRDEQIKVLQVENARLNNLVIMSMANKYGVNDSTDTLSASDIETLRAVFDSCDTDALGSLGIEQIGEVMKRLGEPLNEEELKEMMKSLGEKNESELSKQIPFNSFLMWWSKAHKGGKRGGRYRKMFKFKQAKLNLMGDFDIDNIITTPVGPKGTTEFRVTFKYQQKNGKVKQISPWHDIPLRHGQTHIYNFICEIPKWTRAKYEIATGETFNPIRQDVKNGKLRFYEHGDMMWNYGAFPQTWENPEHIPEDTKYPGDNDPLDVIELGTRQLPTGSITAVKILGILALLDSGETDWKVFAINIKDPLANVMHDVHDIDKYMPGCIEAIRDWLRIYKVCTGAVENQYALRGEALNEEYAKRVIEETHQQWLQLNEEGRREVGKT